MIRITFDNGITKEYQGCIWDFYDFYGEEEVGVLGVRHFFQKSRIVKFEKQVKDLTLEEMGKLHLAEKYTDGNFTELEGAVHLGTYKIYKLDDYIDITDLIKEQGNE